MRNLFICFLLAMLAALLQRGPDPVIEPATYLGILVVFPVLGARLFRNWRLPPAVGAIAAGAVLGELHLLTPGILHSVSPFRDAGFIWLGLFLGTQIARRPTLRAPSVVSALAIVTACALLVCLATAVFPLSLLERLRIGLAGAICAPIYTLLQRTHHRDEIGITALATVMALTLLGVTELAGQVTRGDTVLAVLSAAGLVTAAEIAFRSVRAAVSGPGRYLVYILLMGALWRGAGHFGIHPGAVGIAFGFAFGLRARGWHETTAPLAEASSFVGPFVLGFVSAEIPWGRVLDASANAWTIALAILIPVLVGKAAGAAVTGTLTRFSQQAWMTAYPLGLGAIVVLPSVVPKRLFLEAPHPDVGVLPIILAGSVGIPLLVCAFERVGGYLASRRNAAASSGGMELT